MSSFSHNIHIYDNQGRASVEGAREILANLANADIVILALDPTSIINGLISSTQYADMVKDILSILEKANPEKQRLYAVCITKGDLIPGGVYLHPDAIVEAYFGREMSDALLIPQKGMVQTFTTSSFGFFPDSTEPNFDFDSAKLANKEHWQPYGVEFPFFWAFETQERSLLRKTLQNNIWGKLTYYGNYKNYIPYPKPKYEL